MTAASTTPVAPASRRTVRNRRWLLVGSDCGSASAELVLLMPVLILLVYFVVYCERGAEARMRLNDAAHQAARTASQARTPSQASQDARASVTAALRDAGIACQHTEVETAGSLRAGSTVTVVLTCTVGLEDLALLPLPGDTTLSARFSAPVDVYRGTSHTARAREG